MNLAYLWFVMLFLFVAMCLCDDLFWGYKIVELRTKILHYCSIGIGILFFVILVSRIFLRG